MNAIKNEDNNDISRCHPHFFDMEFELVHLRNALLPLVISSQHSLNVLKFYKELRSERKVTWGEGSSLLTGIAQFPEKNERKHL